MYPIYRLEVYDHVTKTWHKVAHMEASNQPHHYDVLRPEFERLVRNAKEGASKNQKPIGYRITSNGHPVDTWDNGKIIGGNDGFLKDPSYQADHMYYH